MNKLTPKQRHLIWVLLANDTRPIQIADDLNPLDTLVKKIEEIITNKDQSMSHERGEIEAKKGLMGETYFRIYTGCKYLDDFYTTNTLENAEAIKTELLTK